MCIFVMLINILFLCNISPLIYCFYTFVLFLRLQSMILSHYKLSVVYLSQLNLQNMAISEKWLFYKKDFFRVHIDSKYTPCPLVFPFDFAFSTYAEAARYASMFFSLDHTCIHLEIIHFNKI